MGIATDRFPGLVDENLLCSVCSGVLEDAVLTPCGHAFCQGCLATWLESASGNQRCPECRGPVAHVAAARPIHAIRNLVQGLQARCQFHARGCQALFRLETLPNHHQLCGYGPVKCAGCDVTVSRMTLMEHHSKCPAMLALSLSLKPGNSRARPSAGAGRRLTEHSNSDVTASRLGFRVTSLEIQTGKLREDLATAESKNRRLDLELTRTRDELEKKKTEVFDQKLVYFDPDYEYGYTPQSVVQLTELLGRFLCKKPIYVDADRIFQSIKRCFDNFAALPISIKGMGREIDGPSTHSATRRRGKVEVDFPETASVHLSSPADTFGFIDDTLMLLATANASDWFRASQRGKIHDWLKVMLDFYARNKSDVS